MNFTPWFHRRSPRGGPEVNPVRSGLYQTAAASDVLRVYSRSSTSKVHHVWRHFDTNLGWGRSAESPDDALLSRVPSKSHPWWVGPDCWRGLAEEAK